jgi:hypothetical protein
MGVRVFIFFVAVAVSAAGQTVLSPPNTVLKFHPALFAVPVGQNLPAAIFSDPGSTAGDAPLLALGQWLTNFEAELQAFLPQLAAFNSSFEISATGAMLMNAANPPTHSGALLARDFSTNLGVNLSTSLGQDLSQSLATSTGGTPPGTLAIGAGGRGLLIPPPTAPAAAPADAPGLASYPVTRYTLRALLVLQTDLERALAVIQTLNNGGTSTNSAGVNGQ